MKSQDIDTDRVRPTRAGKSERRAPNWKEIWSRVGSFDRGFFHTLVFPIVRSLDLFVGQKRLESAAAAKQLSRTYAISSAVTAHTGTTKSTGSRYGCMPYHTQSHLCRWQGLGGCVEACGAVSTAQKWTRPNVAAI